MPFIQDYTYIIINPLVFGRTGMTVHLNFVDENTDKRQGSRTMYTYIVHDFYLYIDGFFKLSPLVLHAAAR
jgi:hypothetical protein